MNILVATDGILDPKQTADAVARWYEEGDAVTVFTSMNLPRQFLRSLGEVGVPGLSEIALEAGQTLGAGDRAAERLTKAMPAKPIPRTDSPVLHAMATAAISRTKPIVDELKQRDIPAKGIWRSSEYRTARTILATIKEQGTEIVIIGSHGHGKHEGRLGSTATKVVRMAPTTVLILRTGDGD